MLSKSSALALCGCYCTLAFSQTGNFGDLRNLTDRNSDTHTAWTPPRTPAAWTTRRAELKSQILAAAGLLPALPRTPLKPQMHGAPVRRPKYSVQKLTFESLPGLHIAGNLYLPAAGSANAKKIPAVLVAHGHWKHGRVHNEDDYSVPALCVHLASQGIAAFAWDMLGYNDTRQLPHEFGDSQEEQSWSFHPLGIQLWTAIRAIDLLESFPYIDSSRIGMTGASGGGTQTFLTAAVDERIAAAAPVNMISAGFQGDDACEIAPTLRLGTNNVEIAAMIAPRSLLMISATKDWTKNTPREEFPLVRSVYELSGAGKRVSQIQIDAEHNYNLQSRQAAYTFFARTLKGAPAVLDEKPFDLEVNTDLLLGGEFAKSEKDGKKHVFATWKRLTSDAARKLPLAEWQRAVEFASGIRWPARVRTLPTGSLTVLTRSCCGDRVPAQFFPGNAGTRATVVQVHKDGMREAVKMASPVAGAARLLVDVFQRGAAETPRRPSGGADYLTFHMSDDANRLQDILTAIAYANQGADGGAGPAAAGLHLQCAGDGDIVALCYGAAALARVPVQVQTGDEGESRHVFIPGLDRLGGIEAFRVRMRQRIPAGAAATSTVR